MKYDRKEDLEFIRWAKAIKQRDFYTCQLCSRRGVELHSHHIMSWDAYPEERYSMDCGITLCARCHNSFHGIYGYGKNNREQFDEFVITCETLIKEAELTVNKNNIAQEILMKAIGDSIMADGYSSFDGYEEVVE
jgi:hypothetical protein